MKATKRRKKKGTTTITGTLTFQLNGVSITTPASLDIPSDSPVTGPFVISGPDDNQLRIRNNLDRLDVDRCISLWLGGSNAVIDVRQVQTGLDFKVNGKQVGLLSTAGDLYLKGKVLPYPPPKKKRRQ